MSHGQHLTLQLFESDVLDDTKGDGNATLEPVAEVLSVKAMAMFVGRKAAERSAASTRHCRRLCDGGGYVIPNEGGVGALSGRRRSRIECGKHKRSVRVMQ